MELKDFAAEICKMAKDKKEGGTSKWIRRNPNASRLVLGAPIAGAISAKPGERLKSFGKGVGAATAGGYGGGAAGAAGGAGIGALVGKLLRKGGKRGAIAGALAGGLGGMAGGSLYGHTALARKWQKKHEKKGPTK